MQSVNRINLSEKNEIFVTNDGLDLNYYSYNVKMLLYTLLMETVKHM